MVCQGISHRIILWLGECTQIVERSSVSERNLIDSVGAIDWLAQLTTHIPGMRRQTDKEDDVPALIDSDLSVKEFRRNWARLIQKVYEIDPLVCPKCQGELRVISVIEDQAIIKKILQHLGLWETRSHDPPACIMPHTLEFTYDDAYAQIPAGDEYLQ